MFGTPPIVCHHDFDQCALDESRFPANVRFVNPHVPTAWGDISLVRATLASLEMLHRDGRGPDWTYLLSGSDYPVKPAEAMRHELESARGDAFLDYRLIDEDYDPHPVPNGLAGLQRAEYVPLAYRRYRSVYIPRPSLRRPLDWPMTGRTYLHGRTANRLWGIFDRDYHCYAGSQWFTAGKTAILRLLDDEPRHQRLMAYLAPRHLPDECAFQIMLLNTPGLRIVNDNLRYTDWGDPKLELSHPRGLGVDDLPAIVASGAHFARKIPASSPLLDELDEVTRG